MLLEYIDTLKVGKLFPTEMELCEQFDINRLTRKIGNQ